ncbi:MAG: hypothetical protein AAFY28_03385 [Actinomycetota bacterium]
MWWFERDIVESGRLPLMLCFAAFLVTFAATRTITRLIRAGRGPFKDASTESGLHVHHAIPGVVVLVAGAFLAVGTQDSNGWAAVSGVLVGIGTSLVLDEFALILRLDDVYWAEEGRMSVEVVALAVAVLGFALIGFNPFVVDNDRPVLLALTLLNIVVHLVALVVCVAKGKYRTGIAGVFIPLFGIVGAWRLAKPDSRWAQRRYRGEKMERAVRRQEWLEARVAPRRRAIVDAVAGSPSTRGRDGSDTVRESTPVE